MVEGAQLKWGGVNCMDEACDHLEDSNLMGHYPGRMSDWSISSNPPSNLDYRIRERQDGWIASTIGRNRGNKSIGRRDLIMTGGI